MANNPRTSSSSTVSNDRLTAFFPRKENAFRAISELKSAGFTEDQIGLATSDDTYGTGSSVGGSTTGVSERSSETQDKGFWHEVKDFFTGGDADEDVNRSEYSMSDIGYDENRSSYYHHGIGSGGAVVTVIGNRIQEARTILERNDGDLRESGFDVTQGAQASNVNPQANRTSEMNLNRTDRADLSDVDRDQRILLRGEMLRTYKERVQRGEVKLRKEVVTENQTVQVPVTREELVIERMPATNQTANAGEIGTDQEIRVPLSEERVRVEKKPVVNEEVRVGKRQVQDTRQVSDEVRHEELRVEKDGDVSVEGENITSPKRKKPAA